MTKYSEEILYSKFKQLPLEERAQILIKNYLDNKNVKIKMDTGEGLFEVSDPFIEAWNYAENKKYVELVGGTPKSGPAYKITSDGLEFLDKAL